MNPEPGEEVPWFNEPPDAVVFWSTKELGYLYFIDPLGKKMALPVTRKPLRQDSDRIVWRIRIEGNVATVSPSVHHVGHWHTPNPVQFKLIELIG